MNSSYTHAPHRGGAGTVQATAPNAALLIDFDNVTMGMRSDLSKDLRKLLESDIIKGKVTVQRAYADWRRYPQYIVPLSENSIDLIFAPAYGSSKKNATDIRMAIDGMELVFTRPEIGTYILLTGDSDFSSLVLKLKEYGKYVIGVGIQESSSDILVQNCDEYYSYTNLAGLQKTDETGQKAQDPWILTEKAVKRMSDRNDVMRSDRLKQVMMELDPAFDEGNFGYSKFSKFLTEAASKGLVQLKKMDNGQYEVLPAGGGGGGGGESRGRRSDDRGDRGRRSDERGRRRNGGRGRSGGPDHDREERREPAASGDPMKDAYELLRRALERLVDDGREAVRDSDVKRKMLEMDRSFDEGELGFSKFSLFLRQADDDGVVALGRRDSGNYEVTLDDGGEEGAAAGRGSDGEEARPERREDASPREHVGGEPPRERTASSRSGESVTGGRRLGPRRGSTRRRGSDGGPELFEGQVVKTEGDEGAGAGREAPKAPPASSDEGLDLARLGLPTDADAAKRYLANSYKGVGVKTAETLVDALGDDIFEVLHSDPQRIHDLIPSNRADTIIEAWRDDLRRRREGGSGGRGRGEENGPGDAGRGGPSRGGRRRTRRGGRG